MLLRGYRAGFFPMPIAGGFAWFRPDPRGIIPLRGLRVSRSLAKSGRRLRVTVDTDFAGVLAGCADPGRPGCWIDDDLVGVYRDLHSRGDAHSVEVRDADGTLAGGLFGVAVGGLFAAESMFHRQRDASKVALVALVDLLITAGHPEERLLDCQWLTPHLASLGAREVSADQYDRRLRVAVGLPAPEFDGEAPTAAGSFDD